MNKFQDYLEEVTKPALRFDMSKVLKQGDAIYDKDGNKVDEIEDVEMRHGSAFSTSVKVFTRAGYTIFLNSKTGGNAQGWTNRKPPAPPAKAK